MPRPTPTSTIHRPLEVPLPPLAPDAPPARREDIDGGHIYLLRGALHPRGCRAIIAFAERQGFAPAGLAIGGDRYRENERLRIYRYAEGQYFRPHVDVQMELPGGGQTRASLMVYLNDDFEGGQTRFFARKPRGSSRKRNNPVTHSVVPERGSALVFDHLRLHEGAAVSRGVKYAIRSDLIY
ncbi:MAG: hypothetical protein ACI8S6_005773 [Myxococcota bacterium]|jgi:hypothetical protein